MDHSLPESWFQDPEDAEVASAPAGDASEAAGSLASVEVKKDRVARLGIELARAWSESRRSYR